MNHLFKANEEYKIEIKSYWLKEDLKSHKRYCSTNYKIFDNF